MGTPSSEFVRDLFEHYCERYLSEYELHDSHSLPTKVGSKRLQFEKRFHVHLEFAADLRKAFMTSTKGFEADLCAPLRP